VVVQKRKTRLGDRGHLASASMGGFTARMREVQALLPGGCRRALSWVGQLAATPRLVADLQELSLEAMEDIQGRDDDR
jgi:hypothetical protein